MTRRTTGFEALPNGTALNASNHGGDTFAQVAIAGGTLTGDTSRAAHGGTSLRATHGSGGINSASWTEAGGSRIGFRFYTFHTAINTGGTIMAWLGIGGTRVVDIQYRPTGKVRVTDNAGGSGIYTTTSDLPLNQWVRHEIDVTVGTSTSNGRIRYAMYLGDSTTPIDAVFDSSTLNTGTTPITTGRLGAYNTGSDATPFWYDDPVFDDAVTGFIGPYSVAAAATVRPSSVSANPGTWVNQAGAAPTGASLADEDDATYITNPGAAASEAIVLTLPPMTAGALSYLIRLDKPITGTIPTWRLDFMEGATVRATRDITPSTATAAFDSGTGRANYLVELTTAETNAVTARTDLRLRITANPT